MSPHFRSGRRACNQLAEALWHLPGRFSIARALGPRYTIRCVLFHDASDFESPFTKGLNVTVSVKRFEAALKFLKKHYTPIHLRDLLADPYGGHLPRRPVLVSFDDGYASIANIAVPLCSEYGVPTVIFANAACLDNRRLALDNLICYLINTKGVSAIAKLIELVTGRSDWGISSMAMVFSHILPALSLERRQALHKVIVEQVGIPEADLAMQASLYLTSQQLRMLAGSGCEIGNHTYTHVHCRLLSGNSYRDEIDRNKEELEMLSGARVRSFSVPYGSAMDLTSDLAQHLSESGHDAIFLSGSVANVRGGEVLTFDRVSARAANDASLFSEIEVLPRFRAIRNAVKGRRAQAMLVR